MLLTLMTLALIGLAISAYTYVIEQKVKAEPTYKATCDLSDRVSCTKVIRSPYATMFYFSNSFLGLIFYTALAVLAYWGALQLVFVAAIGACCMSLVLAYILYAKIKTFCILCTSLYVVNFLILVTAAYQLFV